MPLPAQRMRLCFTCALPCYNTLLFPSILQPQAIGKSAQRRILRTSASLLAASDTTRRIPLQRSPHQWSHIVHRARKPQALSTSPVMATDTQLNAPQARTFMGHSHGHGHHHHDNTFLTSANKKDAGVRITRIGLYVNLGMAIAKGAGGYVFNSQA